MIRLRSNGPGLLAILALAAVAAAQQDEGAPDPFRFGPYETTIGPIEDPGGVAIAGDGEIFIAETGEARVAVFDREGARLRTIGRRGSGSGEMSRPRGVGLAKDGTLFVADGGNHKILVFDSSGTFVREWGAHGTAPLEFKDPQGLAVDAWHVYVADLGNDRVQVFDHDGALVRVVGSRGAADGRFNGPAAVAVDNEGFIYVTDADNNRVQKFDPVGAHVVSWGDYGPHRGLMDQPTGIACRDGEVFVADTRNHRIQVFDRHGDLHLQWGIHAIRLHEGEGRLHYPDALALAPSGAFGVICESFENRAQVFAMGDPDEGTPTPARAIKAKQSHFGASIDVDGRLLAIAEPETHLLHVFETGKDVPILIGSFGERGKRFGQVIRASGLEIDAEARRLYVTDSAMRRIQIFALSYDPADSVKYSTRRGWFTKALDLDRLGAVLAPLALRWPVEPVEIERSPANELYVIDPRNAMVLVFDSNLGFLRAWGGYGSGTGRFRRPTGLAFGSDGRTVFVVDADNQRVQVFDDQGGFLRAWGEAGDGDGRFKQPFGVAAGRDGFVYVTDAAAHRVQKFTEDGVFVTAWGEHGTDHGQFWNPRGIEQDDRLRVLVVDQGNHRAQIFTPDGAWQVTCGTGRAFTADALSRD